MKVLICLVSILAWSGTALAADAQGGPSPARVVVALVQERLVAENTPIVGTLYFDKVSKVSTEVSGLVQSIPLRAGDRRNKGDVLVGLNTDFIEKEIDLALSRIEQGEVKIERIEKDLKRFEALYRENAATEKAYDDLLFNRRELRKQREALIKEMEVARLKKAKSTIRAPFDGIILKKCAEVGEWVGPGAVFCHLGALDELYVKVPIAEEIMNHSREGDKIQVILTAFQESVPGVVAGFLPVADLKTKNVTMKIQLPRISGVVENMSATVMVPTSRPQKLLLVPRSAIVNQQGRDLVYTVKEGKAVAIPIHKISAFTGEYAGVNSPSIVAGMSVIVDGGQRLMPDQPVQIVDER
jgi:membrane fusion protein (multidrug efflux system)